MSEDDVRITGEEIRKLYAGRATPGTLIWARSNRSSCVFEHTVESLAQGRQPDIATLAQVCYLMRNTGLDGNGTFGTRSFRALEPTHPLRRPLDAQMLSAYLMRVFSIDLVNHLARCRSADAVELAPEIQRFLGVGNGSALGLVLFVNNHPHLVHHWLTSRERAIVGAAARARAARRKAGAPDRPAGARRRVPRRGPYGREGGAGGAHQAGVSIPGHPAYWAGCLSSPMHITLRQLKYFVEIARSRSFSRAAQHLGVAQPALSQNIATLEDELGGKLFERHARGVELSPAGHRLYARAIELLAGFDALKDEVEGREARPSGPVRLSIAGSLASVVVAPLLRIVSEVYPEVELTVREGLSFETRMQVESGQAHLALMPSPSELQGVESLPILEERFMLFGPYAAMRREPKELSFADVARRPLAAPDRAHDLRKIIERAAAAIDQPLNVRYELNSPPMLIAVVKAGLAHAVMPPSACVEALAAKAIAGRPVVEPELSRVQAIVWPRQRPLTPAATAIRGALVRIVGELVEEGQLHGRLLDATHKKS